MRIFRMILECATPLHCGGGEDPLQDQPVCRDAFGLWRIPGSSLAGALRSLAASLDETLAESLFGLCQSDKRQASLVWCEDALLLDYDGQGAAAKILKGQEVALPTGPFVRDHVRLDLELDSAVDGGKFDAEIVPAGARFFVEFRCDGWNNPLTEKETQFFDELCARALAGNLELGGKNANGYGRYRVLEHSYTDLNLKDPADMAVWLNLSRGAMPKKPEGKTLPLSPTALAVGADLSGTVEIPLVCPGPILIGGGSPILPDGKISEADMNFALSPLLDYQGKTLRWRPVLPGTSLKGMLRHACYRIMRDRGLDEQAAESRLKNLFGHIDEGGQCGKLAVEDCAPGRDTKQIFAQHVAIDRFSGGAVDGALFSEEPVWTADLRFTPRLHLRGLTGSEAAIFFHLLLDLAQGNLAAGSGVNRGNGRLCMQAADPAAILADLSGNLAWRGAPLLTGSGAERLQRLQTLAREWENEVDA